MKKLILISIPFLALFIITNNGYSQDLKRDTSIYNEHQVVFEHMDYIPHVLGLKMKREFEGDTSCLTVNADPYWISCLVTNEEYNEYLNSIKEDSLPLVYYSALPDDELIYQKIEALGITLNTYFTNKRYRFYPVLGINWYQAKRFCAWKTIIINKELEEEGLPRENIYRIPIQAEIENAKNFENINLPRIAKIDSIYPANELLTFNKTISEWTGEAFIKTSYLSDILKENESNDIVIYKKQEDMDTYKSKESGYLNIGFRLAQTYRKVPNSE